MKIINNIKAVYIHIPFCKNICSYCDFCKFYYHEKTVDDYLESLSTEIDSRYQKEMIDTIYIGGGTPSMLSVLQLEKLFSIIKKININEKIEFTIECNIEDITLEKMELFKNNGINRLSIGIQSFNQDVLSFLDRNYNKETIINNIKLAKRYFDNINIDLIYATPIHTIDMLKKDLELFLDLDVSHISTYSLIIEDNTKLKIDGTNYIDEKLDREMYDLIDSVLEKNGYIHYEISNFSKEGYQSKHNLTYWKNERYYGFGLGASGYIDNIRYTNTKNIKKYLNFLFVQDEEVVTKEIDTSNYAILGLRTIYGVDKNKFYNLFGKDLVDYFKVNKLVDDKILLESDNIYHINKDYWYLLNEILINFI